MMLHKGASTQQHSQQVLVKPRHSPSDRDQQARQKLQQKAKIRSGAYIQLGEDTLKTVHRTFQEGLNCLEMTDYFFTNIEPKPIIVERPPAHHSTSTSHQPLNGDKVSQQTHPQQPEEIQIHPSMLINRQVPVLNLTDTKITSHANLQDAFNSLRVCSHGRKEDTQDQHTK